ncbi:Holliday junction resolvase YqgF [Gordonia bronchialis DSM 43247]|uniref:Putative pre-16S rRNA nuclease n=1 Tax=Gordonia bronchialis (strain ATCC 25592 / DSM 43247 / BCRC 13721 / JCM 3198 / KCTC 3076 / NBRC 16047 / NCTC 10667) TaxID=526226 RepID=D0LCP5_GORB4|nr:Holliday junction resolvase RuvX [Gordonia bronchialis]ACY21566.1 Holliday junction resolvase YqgF [Gordonia bronchialis DSM 43247]MCC3324351.1 Holliday junction resolvase RuvX [Gordonia bronchialis]QGS24794.1 Holliday junction resolvase RuvX [Gordonia bronchialis]UAK38961.1 Holliday junction resolvase RuvX [Gordonia bronchialis]STQ64448.1 Putative Holliday junction resolvase [Gordonia bronchialis]
MSLTRGRRLGVDVGSVRIGVAVCDPDGILATPVETVARTPHNDDDIERIATLVDEYDAAEVIVGLPKTLRNEAGAAAEAARDFGDRLAARIAPVGVSYHDERLTTVTAHQAMRASGRNAKSSRAVIDQAAAVAILQGWLDARR